MRKVIFGARTSVSSASGDAPEPGGDAVGCRLRSARGWGGTGPARAVKMLIIPVLISISLLAGCASTDTLRIVTVPDQAQIYVDGEYAGLTPYTVNVDWYKALGISVGGTTHLTLGKEGYKPVEKTSTVAERQARKRSGDYVRGSESGLGATYLYEFRLEPVEKK